MLKHLLSHLMVSHGRVPRATLFRHIAGLTEPIEIRSIADTTADRIRRDHLLSKPAGQFIRH